MYLETTSIMAVAKKVEDIVSASNKYMPSMRVLNRDVCYVANQILEQLFGLKMTHKRCCTNRD